MDNAPSFVIPAGAVFEIHEDGVVIENAGDVVLHSTLGRALKRVVSSAGSVEVHGDVGAGEIHAHGGVTIHGALHASLVGAGGSIEIGGEAQVDALQAGGAVTVRGSSRGQAVQAGGVIWVEGGLSARSVHAGGAVHVRGDLAAEGLVGGGEIRVGGTTTVRTIHAGGDLHAQGDVTADEVDVAGVAHLSGKFGAGVIRAGDIELGDGAVTARGLQASRSVRIGAGRLQVDAILAPQVDIAPGSSGRVTIIESQNELGPTSLKGKLRLADYLDMFGDPAPYLAERGLAPLGEGTIAAPPAAAPVEVTSVHVAPPPAAVVPEAPAEAAGEPAHEAAPEPAPEPQAAPEPVAAPAAEAVVDDVDVVEEEAAATTATAPVEVEIEEAEEAEMESSVPSPTEHPLHADLLAAVTRIADCYGDGEVPPAVTHLQELIAGRQYDMVRAEITTIWSDLLKFHHKKGMRIPQQHLVTSTFNTINSLVKKM